VVLAAVVGFMPGCTLFDEVLPGTPFTPEQPKGEVTVVGQINISRAAGNQEGCSSGRAVLWGIARNTGDVVVDDVFIEIDALDGGGNVLDTYRVNVFNGEVTEVTGATPEDNVQIAGTKLDVDQSGSFEVCTRLGFGSVAGTAYRTDFTIIEEVVE
jgi:hypothetical protein